MTNIPNYTNYWIIDNKLTKSTANHPLRYANKKHMSRACNIINQLRELHINSDSTIIELGCNIGRNLELLRKNNFTNLTGIDINPYAFDSMIDVYPELYNTIEKHIGCLGIVLPKLNKTFDVVFTMAVLMHIDDIERTIIYDWLTTHCKYIIMIEPFVTLKKKINKRLFNPLNAVEELTNRQFDIVYNDRLPCKSSLSTKYSMITMINNNLK